MNSGGLGGADFSLPRRLQPTSSLFSDMAGHRLKPMLQAEARATSRCSRPQATRYNLDETVNSPDPPYEIYTPERIAKFLLSCAVGEGDYQAACESVRELGLDPEQTAGYRHSRKHPASMSAPCVSLGFRLAVEVAPS